MKVHLPYLKILEGIKEDTESGLWSEQQIRCKTGEWVDSAALKLQKDSWTVGGMGEGVFFSVWVGEDDVRKGRFNYNIHALKLRLWEGYAIKSNDFASSFRDRMQGELDGWPNVRIDYGPQTLFYGSNNQ